MPGGWVRRVVRVSMIIISVKPVESSAYNGCKSLVLLDPLLKSLYEININLGFHSIFLSHQFLNVRGAV